MSDIRDTAQPVEPYIDARRLAVRMGISVSTVKRWTAQGMPSETWGMARTRRYLPSACMAWARDTDGTLRAQQQPPAARLITARPDRQE
jgi:hypothetical protein